MRFFPDAPTQLVLSASDITDHLACPHLFAQKVGVAKGERKRPPKQENAHADLVRERGDAHEAEQLAVLTEQMGGATDLQAAWEEDHESIWPQSLVELHEQAELTAEAMRRGDGLIFQATLVARFHQSCGRLEPDSSDLDGRSVRLRGTTPKAHGSTAQIRLSDPSLRPGPVEPGFTDGTWQGRTDFLRRVDGEPSDLGDFAYEVLDTKLARQVTPKMVHQLALYDRLIARVQGRSLGVARIVLGDAREEEVDLTRYAAVTRRVRARVEALAADPPRGTYPEPVAHCPICPYERECDARRRADDHLSLVANARRSQRDTLERHDAPITTLAALASAPTDDVPKKLGAERFELLRHQARLQKASRESGETTRRHLAPRRRAGYAALPPASPGDVYFDLEGDPYVGTDGGIEYLWGWHVGDQEYECVWAHDPEHERAALEAFVDRIGALREQHPDLHVYHYAPHERSKLRSLAAQYATREDEVDQLLRDEVLVDLYAVVRHGLQVGEESYSLKALERHHGFVRTEESVRGGGGSIVMYEEWLRESAQERLAAAREGREPGPEAAPDERAPRLEAIRAYNEEDCRSTKALRDWLADEMRPEAAAELGADFDELSRPDEAEEPRGMPPWLEELQPLIADLRAGLPADPSQDDDEQRFRRMASHLPLYHHRDMKPAWWRHFDLRSRAMEELYDETEAIAGIERDHSLEPEPVKKSLVYDFTFDEQETKLGPGTHEDPFTGERCRVVAVGEGRLRITRGMKADAPDPTALVSGEMYAPGAIRDALIELATHVHAGERPYPAAEALLRREPPRLVSGRLGESVEDLISATLGLRESVLPVQGPPGTGKTYRGARMIVAAIRAGLRVGVTAFSHAAIQNMMEAVGKHADELGIEVHGAYKAGTGGRWKSEHRTIETVWKNGDVHEGHRLAGGTAWFFAAEQQRQAFDLLFVDEAGQYSLMNAAAVATSAKSVVLLGDPQQLPQVSQADHPDGSGASALEHLIGDAATVREGRGVLLTESWRMHPDVCAFVSERSYEGRLGSRAECSTRRIDAPAMPLLSGAGLRAIPVAHEGNAQRSVQEAVAIDEACRALLDHGTVTDAGGVTRRLSAEDLLVVAPYNLARREIAARVPSAVKVGTVDKFQGREAPVVFYALTCSTGEDVPRGLDFLFDQHRLNVAVSRAQCLAVLVHSPDLLDADAKTLRAMGLLDGACRFVEAAAEVPAAMLGERMVARYEAGGYAE